MCKSDLTSLLAISTERAGRVYLCSESLHKYDPSQDVADCNSALIKVKIISYISRLKLNPSNVPHVIPNPSSNEKFVVLHTEKVQTMHEFC